MATTEDFTVTATDDTHELTTFEFYYNNDYEDECCIRTSPMQFGATITSVFFSLVVILSLFGNILVIVILAKYENLRSLSNVFILNLALSDLFFTAGLPFWAYYHMYGWTLGEPACKTVMFVFSVGYYSSGILLILMTVYRYIAVLKPRSDVVSTKGCCSLLAGLVIWAVSVLVSIPAVIFTKVQGLNHCVYENSYWTVWGIYQQNALFILSSVVFIFCYSQIVCRLLRPTAQRRRNKTLKLIFALMVAFFVGWVPYNTVIFLKSFHHWPKTYSDTEAMAKNCEALKQLEYAFYVSRLCAFSHCCLNPVFYVFVGVKFKNHWKSLLKSWGHSSRLQSRQSRFTMTSLTSGEEFTL
uniref:G-protein coupled receptors family 1 profile domain-containing protein n=1 Tax=Mola mola TaxID=94237 RepID=A0A3Q3WKL8_MOLML